jgi:hypothetical protein
MTVYGEGCGRVYRKTIPYEDQGVGRKEVVTVSNVGGQDITLILRDTIVPEDPYLNLARAAAYSKMTGKIFPAPRVPRSVKDHLIRLNVSI